MRTFFFILIFLGICSSECAKAQNFISGTVMDEEDNPIIAALVTLSVDSNSSVIDQAITNVEGTYKIPLPYAGTYTLNVSCLGFVKQEVKITIPADSAIHMQSFVLKEDAILLNEIMVSARRTGVAFKGDTIKYDPKVFKDGSERVLGDLLNKLPGIQVDETGKVKSQGKSVEKVLFNGRDLFNGNSQVAVKNLSADVAENVEVINNYSEYSLLDGFKTHEGTALNVGVKESFLGKLNGELLAGYGYENKYNFKSNVMKLGNKSMLAFIGSYNNTGAEVFSIDDYIQLQGGAKAIVSHNNSNFISLSEEEKQLLSPKNNVNSRDNGLGSFNFSSQLSSRLKFNGYLIYNTKKEKSHEENRNIYIIPGYDDILFYNQLHAHQRTNFIGSNVNLKYDASETLKIDYKGVFTGNGSFSDADIADTRNNIHISTFDKKNMKSFKMNHNFSFIKGTSNGLFTGDIHAVYTTTDSHYSLQTDSLLLPFTIPVNNGLFTGKQNQNRKDYALGANLGYTHKINHFLLKGGVSSAYQNNFWQSRFEFNDPTANEDHRFNDNRIKFWDNSANLMFSKKEGLLRFNLGGTIHLYNLTVNPLQRNEKTTIKFTPDVDFTLYFSPKNIVKGYYNTEYRSLSPEYMGMGYYALNYKTIITGNQLNTVWTKQHNIGLSYQYYDLFSNTMLFILGGYRKMDNDITFKYTTNGMTTEKIAVNSPRTYTAFANGFIEKGLSKPFKFKLSGNYNLTGITNYIDEIENKIRINNVTGRASVWSTFDTFINAEIFAEINSVDNYSSIYKNSGSQLTQHYGGQLKFNFNNKLVVDIQCGHMQTKIGDFNKEIVLLNGNLKYIFNKKVEMSLTGQNMLHLKSMSWNTIVFDGYQKKEQLFSQIPGHILLNLSYKF